MVTDKLLKAQKDLKVKFYPSDSSGKIKGDQIGEDVTTDEKGVAGMDQRMAPGYFACVVDGITSRVRPVDVQTYAGALEDPYVLGLPRGFLSVRLVFRNLPLKDFKVKFFEVQDGAKKGDPLGTAEGAEEGLPSDAEGVVVLTGDEFKLGNYLCEVGDEGSAFAVSTIEDIKRPYVVSLPVVRPLIVHRSAGAVDDAVEVAEKPEIPSGYLSVRVLFRGLPVTGTVATFYPAGDGGTAATKEPKGTAMTDSEGIATLPAKANLGSYFCQVEGQTGFASISTVEDPKRPYVVALPFVRAFALHQAASEVKAAEVVEKPDIPSGFLSVRVLFRGLPVNGAKVTFYESGKDGKPATDQKGEAITDSEGVAALFSKAVLGNYFALVEGQTAYASISTVEDSKVPYVIALPAGRPMLTVSEPGRVEQTSAPVDERESTPSAYLSVMVLFRNLPAMGLRVVFFASTAGGSPDLGQPKGEAVTDSLGIATLPALAAMGNYFCQVEGQAGYSSISTVEDKDLPYVINIPQARPFLVNSRPGAFTDLVEVQEHEAPPAEQPPNQL